MEQCAKCFSVNIAGLNNSLKRRKIKTLLMQDQVDILCLWETHMRKAEEKYFKGLFYGSIFHAPAPTKSKGVLIWIKNISLGNQGIFKWWEWLLCPIEWGVGWRNLDHSRYLCTQPRPPPKFVWLEWTFLKQVLIKCEGQSQIKGYPFYIISTLPRSGWKADCPKKLKLTEESDKDAP